MRKRRRVEDPAVRFAQRKRRLMRAADGNGARRHRFLPSRSAQWSAPVGRRSPARDDDRLRPPARPDAPHHAHLHEPPELRELVDAVQRAPPNWAPVHVPDFGREGNEAGALQIPQVRVHDEIVLCHNVSLVLLILLQCGERSGEGSQGRCAEQRVRHGERRRRSSKDSTRTGRHRSSEQGPAWLHRRREEQRRRGAAENECMAQTHHACAPR